MKKVKFYELDGENKLTALDQMFSIHKKNAPVDGLYWKSADHIGQYIEGGYSIDDDFSFYLSEDNEVATEKN